MNKSIIFKRKIRSPVFPFVSNNCEKFNMARNMAILIKISPADPTEYSACSNHPCGTYKSRQVLKVFKYLRKSTTNAWRVGL